MSQQAKMPKVFRFFWVGVLIVLLGKIPVYALTVLGVSFLGQATFPTGFTFEKTEVGGLSGITYDPGRQIYYAISDDRAQKGPARFYTLKTEFEADKLNQEGVSFLKVTALLDERSKPFPPLSVDLEGIAFTGKSLLVASEGDSGQKINPFIREFSLEGRQLRTLPIPQKFLPSVDGKRGVRNNLSLETLALSPNRKYLFTATENALVQDGDKPSLSSGSPCRILRYDWDSGQPNAEFIYITEPLVAGSNPAGNLTTNGLVDLVALGDAHLLSLERSFSLETGNVIRLFDVSVENADNIQGVNSLKGRLSEFRPVQKRLLLDLQAPNLRLDNLEGLTLGAELSDGRKTLVLVSDNNFNPLQVTQFVSLGIKFQQTP